MAFTGKLYHEGMTFSGRSDSLSCTRVFRCEPWSQWLEACRYFLGGIRLIGGRMIRVPGLVDPELSGMFCSAVDVEGIGSFTHATSPSGTELALVGPSYSSSARLRVTYETFIPDDIDLLTEDFDVSAQVLTLPNEHYGLLKNGSTLPITSVSADLDVPVGNNKIGATKTMPTVSYSLVRHCVDRVPDRAIKNLLGRINENDLTFDVISGAVHSVEDDKSGRIEYTKKTKTFPAETLRFDGATVRRKVSLWGVHFYEVRYLFEINPVYDKIEDGTDDYVGWNRVFNPVNDRYQRLVLAKASSERQMHQFAEDVAITVRGKSTTGFALLFTPGAP